MDFTINEQRYCVKNALEALNYGHPVHGSLLINECQDNPFIKRCNEFFDSALLVDLLSAFDTTVPIDHHLEGEPPRRRSRRSFEDQADNEERRFVTQIVTSIDKVSEDYFSLGLPLSHFVADAKSFIRFLSSNIRESNNDIEAFVVSRQNFWNEKFRKSSYPRTYITRIYTKLRYDK